MHRSRFTSQVVGLTCRGRWFLAITATLAASALAAPAFANTITFETAPFGVEFNGPVTEDGFTYSVKSGALVASDAFGNPGAHMEGLAYGGGGVLQIVSATAGDFTFDAVDFAAESEPGPETGSATLDVTGMLGGSTVGTDVYTLPIAATVQYNWTTEAASLLAGRRISELDITLNAAVSTSDLFFDAIDNVVLTPASAAVPEPASLALLTTGLLGLVLVRPRTLSPSTETVASPPTPRR